MEFHKFYTIAQPGTNQNWLFKRQRVCTALLKMGRPSLWASVFHGLPKPSKTSSTFNTVKETLLLVFPPHPVNTSLFNWGLKLQHMNLERYNSSHNNILKYNLGNKVSLCNPALLLWKKHWDVIYDRNVCGEVCNYNFLVWSLPRPQNNIPISHNPSQFPDTLFHFSQRQNLLSLAGSDPLTRCMN
jgi:hypothetical protein